MTSPPIAWSSPSGRGGEKSEVPVSEAISGMRDRLDAIQKGLYEEALAYREANTHEITSFDAFSAGVAERGGFWRGPWCGDGACEAEIAARTKATIRFLPLEPTDPGAPCMHCGKPGIDVAHWARAY